jgi:hypothetical protein
MRWLIHVVPAQAGIHAEAPKSAWVATKRTVCILLLSMGSRLRGNDGSGYGDNGEVLIAGQGI